MVSELKGKDINEVIAEGSSKLASMPSGDDYWQSWGFVHWVSLVGGAVVASSGATGDDAGDAPAEEKKEEKKEESEAESDDDMGFGLFDWCPHLNLFGHPSQKFLKCH